MTELEEQLEFTFGDPTEILQIVFDSRLPKSLHVSTNPKQHGQWTVPKWAALKDKYPYIQYNHENLITKFVIDIDTNIAHLEHEGFSSIGLPEPSWWTVNRTGNYGHAHVCYELIAPVSKSIKSHKAPIKYLAAIEEAFYKKFEEAGIKADRGFNSHLCKNPNSDKFKLINTGRVYGLSELEEWVKLPKRKYNMFDYDPKGFRHDYVGAGRHCALFEHLRFFSYAQVRHCSTHEQLYIANLQQAEIINSRFEAPLPHSHLRATTKQVSKWTWETFDLEACDERFQRFVENTHTPEIQRQRGYASGQARFEKALPKMNEALELKAQGLKQKEIAERLDVNQATISRWLKGSKA